MRAKILTLIVLALALAFMSQSAFAGIQYGTPVDIFTSRIDGQQSYYTPCSCTTSSWQTGSFIREFDLNNDGIDDISMTMYESGGTCQVDGWKLTTLNSNTYAYRPDLTTGDSTAIKNTAVDEASFSQGAYSKTRIGASAIYEWFFVRTITDTGIANTYKVKSSVYGASFHCTTFDWIKASTWEYPNTIDDPYWNFNIYPVTLDDGIDSRYDIELRALDVSGNVTDGTETFYEFNDTFGTSAIHRFDRLGEVADTTSTGGLSFSGDGIHSRNYDICSDEIMRFDSGGNTSYRVKTEAYDNLVLQVTGTATPDSSITVYNNPNTRYLWAKKTASNCDLETSYSDFTGIFCTADSMAGGKLCVRDTFKKLTYELDVNDCSVNAQHNFTWDITMGSDDPYCDFFDTPTKTFASFAVTKGYQYNITNDAYKINETLGESHQVFAVIENDFGAFGTGSIEFDITGTTSYETCTANYYCTPFSDCYDVGGGVELRSRSCSPTTACPYGTEPDETEFCNIADLPDEPEAFALIPTLTFPDNDGQSPNLDSQSITGIGCFTNWYGYGDNMINRMEYTIDGVTTTLYPEDSKPVCELGIDCAKSRGYIQTWDYIDNYFTEYEDSTENIIINCYDENTTAYSFDLNISMNDRNQCPKDADISKKECFSSTGQITDNWYFGTDINKRNNSHTYMQRQTIEYNEPDKQKYRLSTDIINYFGDINDAHNQFGNINQEAGYQIWKAFDTPQSHSQIYFDMFITDTAPKFVLFLGSSPTLHAEAMIVFYNQRVYYYDGFGINLLGNYQMNIPYTYEIDIDIPNNKLKVGQRTWDMYYDIDGNVGNWRRIGDWETNKIGTLIYSDSGHDNIQYVAVTMMSDSCELDVDCVNKQLQRKFYGGHAGQGIVSYPTYDSEHGWKSTLYAGGVPDEIYAKYYNDEGKFTGGGTSNNGQLTIPFDEDDEGIFMANGSQLSIKYKVGTSTGCAGSIDRNLTVRIWDTDLAGYRTLFNGSISGEDIWNQEVNYNFDTVYLTTRIIGGYCVSSRGYIGIDSIEVVNNTGGDSTFRTCRNYDYFMETFNDVAPYTELNESFNKSMENSDFMLEWDGLDDAFPDMNFDFVDDGGYCYSEFMIDNIESYKNTRSTFGESTYIDDDAGVDIFAYGWIERLGWQQNCIPTSSANADDTGNYSSVCYNYNVCKEHGLNKGAWCVASIHFKVGLELVQEWIFDNFLYFMVLLIIIMMLAYLKHMF